MSNIKVGSGSTIGFYLKIAEQTQNKYKQRLEHAYA